MPIFQSYVGPPVHLTYQEREKKGPLQVLGHPQDSKPPKLAIQLSLFGSEILAAQKRTRGGKSLQWPESGGWCLFRFSFLVGLCISVPVGGALRIRIPLSQMLQSLEYRSALPRLGTADVFNFPFPAGLSWVCFSVCETLCYGTLN